MGNSLCCVDNNAKRNLDYQASSTVMTPIRRNRKMKFKFMDSSTNSPNETMITETMYIRNSLAT